MYELWTILTSAATALGVIVAANQLRQARRQARTQFEDGLVRQYREIIHGIPVDALIGHVIDEAKIRASLSDFYRYFDLCNEQIFLRSELRVSAVTWEQWASGIESNMRRPAFMRAWEIISAESRDFVELRALIRSDYALDPKDLPQFQWQGDAPTLRLPAA